MKGSSFGNVIKDAENRFYAWVPESLIA